METSFALTTLFEAGLSARAEGDHLIVQPAARQPAPCLLRGLHP